MAFTTAPRLPEGQVNRYGFRLERLNALEQERHPGCKWALYDHYGPEGSQVFSIKADPRVKRFRTRSHAEIAADVTAGIYRKHFAQKGAR
jgi:hypothetical protein